ncbi:hypothetical protein J6590_096630 [Homalodisca vitripennis]|nr:hypothetical protein J6590_096630 [Homalodisca vitripennis]
MEQVVRVRYRLSSPLPIAPQPLNEFFEIQRAEFRTASSGLPMWISRHVADSILEEIYSSKFLLMLLDRGLTWNNYLDHVCAKLSSGIYVLRSLARYCLSQVFIAAYYG